MKCDHCHRSIASGVEAQKMICEYVQPDGQTKTFGYMMADGPLTKATGRLLRGWHHKHYHQLRKRSAKGDIVTGRVLPGVPSAYEIATGHGDLAVFRQGIADMQAVARQIGKPVGDSHVFEAYQAKLRGTPYEHAHAMPLDSYQLIAHLAYAHDTHLTAHRNKDGRTFTEIHFALHASATARAIAQQRTQDPGHIEPADTDWREQRVAEL